MCHNEQVQALVLRLCLELDVLVSNSTSRVDLASQLQVLLQLEAVCDLT